MKKHIPNFITLLNLASGVIAILFASQNHLELAAYFVFLGIIFDFLDGYVARLLHAQSELGVQLDSLADMVTSGVVPGIVMFQLLRNADADWSMTDYLSSFKEINFLPLLGIVITLAAAYRLAKFNIDDQQEYDFIGLPTPALTLFVVSLPIIGIYGKNEWVMNLVKDPLFLIVTTILGSILMNANLRLFSLKFFNLSFKDNWVKYLFLTLTVLLIIFFQISAVPIIIITYIVLSILNNLFVSKN